MNFLLIEDHPIYRFGVRQLIRAHWPAAGVEEAATLGAALAALRQHATDVAVLDLNLPDANGVDAMTRLLRVAPALRILVLSLNTENAYATRVLQLGAAGYLSKDCPPEELVAALKRVATGGRFITPALAEHLADLATGQRSQTPHAQLSAQEYRVLLQLAAGKRLTLIAETMNLSPKTVSTYRGRILDKLGVGSNVELARYCLEHALHESPP